MILAILMLGILIGVVYFSSTRVEASVHSEIYGNLLGKFNVDSETILRKEDKEILGKEDWYSYLVSRSSQGDAQGRISKLNPEFASNLKSTLEAAEAAGFRPVIGSGFRSIAKQAALYRNYKNGTGGLAARPGRSRHNYGLAADIDDRSNNTEFQKWMHANSPTYGIYNPIAIRSRDGRHYQQKGSIPASALVSAEKYLNDTYVIQSYGIPNYGVQNYGAQNPILQSLLSSLNGGGNTNNGSSAYNSQTNTEAPYLSSLNNIYADTENIGLFENEDYVTEGTGAIEENTSRDATLTTGATVNTPGNSATAADECVGGTAVSNIYGNVTCVRDSVSTTVESQGVGSTENVVPPSTRVTSQVTTEDGKVVRTISTFVGSIIPTRYLLDGGANGSQSNDGYIFGGPSQQPIYDAYQPYGGTAYGTNARGSSIQEEDIIAWMIKNDLLEEDDLSQQAILTALLGLMRPALLHLTLILFGTGSYGATTLFDVATAI